ncbi:MAG: hypothetical protein HY361_02080 [Candidatus Aenigmarchaeota archaeon]|nr:hypothetical protein [Candidatus Aenigmarchaeota archaeon]
MAKPPEKEGMVLADLHAHPRHESYDKILKMLSWGITGLTETGIYNGVTYQDVLNYPGVREVDRGILAEVTYRGNKGYVIKSQEVLEGKLGPHILAVGCGINIDGILDPRKVVEEIHKQGGLAIPTHPYVTPTGEWPIKYRIITKQEERIVRELCLMVDELETHNSQNINLFPFFLDMRQANRMAKKLAEEYGFKGVATSDTHSRLEQVKISGIYVPEDNISFEALKHYIKNGLFERYEQYVSRLSFLMGHFVG